ncbi:E3 ubiquitin-protein ligase TRIM11-like [Dendropsophus ebraccatus]|uniref:E3 ubiquitin-protein ligase TRIM11-like n=1 Tax=Dendropsophus ebraccatus TaxID=150705 RepID=UPI0038316C8C
MASAELREELNCSICLSLYTDSVSLRCGHNFCRSCIVQVLDTQDGAGGYSCPDCRAEYPERPALEKNRKLGNIVERFLSTQPDMEEARIFCTYCTKSPVPAVKSCLQCENSLCDDHLTAHNKTMDHILTEPTGNFGNKKFPIHKKVLDYFYPHDAACLCVSCCLVGKHKGHLVELLDAASEEKKKKLRKELDDLEPQRAEIETRLHDLHSNRRNIQEKTSDKRKNVSKLFMDIEEQLEKAEKKALSEISRQEEKIVSQMSELIKKLEIEEDELSRKMHHLEEMCHVTDPIRLKLFKFRFLLFLTTMATELMDELICSICHSLYTDPVSLTCGHNFCCSCIIQVLDTQDGAGGYSCPDCRAEYLEHPALENSEYLPDMQETRILDAASEEKKKKLRKYLDELNPQKAEIQTRVQNLHDRKRNIQEKAFDKRRNVSKLFMDIKNQLEMAEKKALSEISRQEEKIVSQISDLIRKLEIEEKELSRKMRHLEEMCNFSDPIRLLQEPDIRVCDHGDGVDTGGDGGKIESEDDLDEVVISMTLHRSMRDIVIHVTSQLGFHVPDILLDEDTAGNYVKVSEDLKTATESKEKQVRPESPGRFLSYPQALSRCGLSSGRHYWEVDWNQIGDCIIGMSHPSIKKKGRASGIGDNDKSWSLIIFNGILSSLHKSVQLNLNIKLSCPTIGVFLDYEAGRLSFYELCDPIRHLHTFTASFCEPLHVAFYMNKGASVTVRS